MEGSNSVGGVERVRGEYRLVQYEKLINVTNSTVLVN